jgi:hypothetical protein
MNVFLNSVVKAMALCVLATPLAFCVDKAHAVTAQWQAEGRDLVPAVPVAKTAHSPASVPKLRNQWHLVSSVLPNSGP